MVIIVSHLVFGGMAHLVLLEDIKVIFLCLRCHNCLSLDECRFAENPYMELVWACIMLITNLVHADTHLEDSKFTNRRTSLRTSSCAYARVVN